MTRQTLALMLALAVPAVGCSTAPADADKDEENLGDGKEDRWNRANDPERFDGEFNYHVADLPLTGSADRDAWPSTYWPTYEDSINVRWDGAELSPAQKYDVAFNGWTPPEGFLELRPFNRNNPVPGDDWDTAYYEQQGPLATHISNNMGNGRDRRQALTAMGAPEGDWETDTWWGLCHAWVPAALLEDRPLRAVEHNGVRFEVADMEALLIAAYNRAGADMIGGRCNVGSGDSMVERDEFGRAVDIECRDSNPGAMHVIVTNYLGVLNRGFAIDRTFDFEVWNQPVKGFEITKQEEIDVARANELLGVTGETYEYNADAAQLFEVNLSLHWITESHATKTPNESSRYTRTDRLTYILEVDADGKIIGGEWFGRSRSQHPDFLWNPRSRSTSSIPNMDLADVRMLVERSRMPEMPDPETGATHVAEGAGGLDIPDNDTTGVTSTATVSGASGAITGVSVALNVTHTYIGDLAFTLVKGDVERTFLNQEGGSDDDIDQSYDVTGFEGLDANGTWTLRATDHAGQDVGTLDGWTLTVTTDSATMPVDPTPDPMEPVKFSGMGGIEIPDNDPAGISSAASVSGITSGSVAIEYNLTHTYRGDLLVTVEHNGRAWTLHDQEGGSAEDLVGTSPLDATGDAFEGDPSGTWTLRVSDNAGADVGTLNSWAVIVTP